MNKNIVSNFCVFWVFFLSEFFLVSIEIEFFKYIKEILMSLFLRHFFHNWLIFSQMADFSLYSIVYRLLLKDNKNIDYIFLYTLYTIEYFVNILFILLLFLLFL